MKKSISLLLMVFAVFVSAGALYSSDAYSQTFWERYFGGGNAEEEAKPKHVFLQPEDGRGATVNVKGSSKTNIKEVHDKLKEVEKKGVEAEAAAQSSPEAKQMQINVSRAQSASEKYESAQKSLEQYENMHYLDMTADQQRAYNRAVQDLAAAEADLNYYMGKIEKSK